MSIRVCRLIGSFGAIIFGLAGSFLIVWGGLSQFKIDYGRMVEEGTMPHPVFNPDQEPILPLFCSNCVDEVNWHLDNTHLDYGDVFKPQLDTEFQRGMFFAYCFARKPADAFLYVVTAFFLFLCAVWGLVANCKKTLAILYPQTVLLGVSASLLTLVIWRHMYLNSGSVGRLFWCEDLDSADLKWAADFDSSRGWCVNGRNRALVHVLRDVDRLLPVAGDNEFRDSLSTAKEYILYFGSALAGGILGLASVMLFFVTNALAYRDAINCGDASGGGDPDADWDADCDYDGVGGGSCCDLLCGNARGGGGAEGRHRYAPVQLAEPAVPPAFHGHDAHSHAHAHPRAHSHGPRLHAAAASHSHHGHVQHQQQQQHQQQHGGLHGHASHAAHAHGSHAHVFMHEHHDGHAH